MPVTPTSVPAIAAEKLRQMVAASSTFQTATGAASRDAALSRVFVDDLLGEPLRPHAIISMGDVLHWGIIAGGEQNHLRADGTLFVYLAVDTKPEHFDDELSAEWESMNFLAGVLQDVADIANADDSASDFTESHLSVTDIEVTEWGSIAEENWNSLGRFYWAQARVTWGDGN